MGKNFLDKDHTKDSDIKNFIQESRIENRKPFSRDLISICVSIKNRSRFKIGKKEYKPFVHFIHSIVRLPKHLMNIELIIADFFSDDYPLKEWIPFESQHIKYKIVSVPGPFSRGKGLNAAAKQSKGKYLFFTDADMLLSTQVIERGLHYAKKSKAFFPIAFRHVDEQLKVGRWFQSGFGNMFLRRSQFEKRGGYMEHDRWGREDFYFHRQLVQKSQVKCVREQIQTFYHQFHPDDVVWKNRFVEKNVFKEIQASYTISKGNKEHFDKNRSKK